MAYNMKRGNSAVPFKELGSSPAKQGIPAPEKLTPEEKIERRRNLERNKPGPWDHKGIKPQPPHPDNRKRPPKPGPWDYSGIPNPKKEEKKKKSPAKQKDHPAGTGDKVEIAKKLAKKHFPKTYEKTKKVVKRVKNVNWSGTLKSDPHMVNTKLEIIKLKEKNNPGTSWTWDPKTNTPIELKK